MRVVVTGAAGYVGSHVLADLLARGDRALVLDSFERGRIEAVRRAEAIGGSAAEVLRVDLCDTAAVTAGLRAFAPDAVIHCAAFKAVGESVAHPERYERNNVLATRSLAAALRELGIGRVVYASTGAVYGDADEPGAIAETSELRPINPYASTKAEGERILAAAAPSVVNLRFFNVCGAHPSGELGEYVDAPQNLLPVLMRELLGSSSPKLTVFGTDWPTRDGSCIRDYVHVCDIASALVAALDATGLAGGARTYNVGTGLGSSVLEIHEAVCRISGVPIERIDGPRRPGDPAICVADPSRIAAELGWKARFTLDDMVRTTLAWTRRLGASG